MMMLAALRLWHGPHFYSHLSKFSLNCCQTQRDDDSTQTIFYYNCVYYLSLVVVVVVVAAGQQKQPFQSRLSAATTATQHQRRAGASLHCKERETNYVLT